MEKLNVLYSNELHAPDDSDSFNQGYNKFNKPIAEQTLKMDTPEQMHEALIQTFEEFYNQESQTMIAAIEESRMELKNSVSELFEDQAKYKELLSKASQGRYVFKRRKENEIPLSEYMRRKKKMIDPEYARNQAVSKALEIVPDTEREAVEKYLRKRDRHKTAEKNQKYRQTNHEQLQIEIIENFHDMDINVDKERIRQAEVLKQKLEEKKNRKDPSQIANDLIDNYQDSTLAQEREILSQKEKLELRLSAARKKSAIANNSNKAVPEIDI